jgi:hypothetical protein
MTLNAVEKEPKFVGSGIYKVCRDGMLEIDEGIDPSKLLLLSFSSFRLERFPITAGISPVKLFAYRKRVVRFVSWPIVAGISPDILLF